MQTQELLAQVFAPPVLAVLESGLCHLLDNSEWTWPLSIQSVYHDCVRRWLGAVRARIGRAFIPMASCDEESQMLMFAQTTLTLAQTALSDDVLSSPSRLVVEDELLHLLELGGDLVALLALKEGVAGCRFEQRVLYLSHRGCEWLVAYVAGVRRVV